MSEKYNITMEINRKRIILNTFFLYGKTLVTMLIAFISTRLILNALGTIDFGIYGTVGGAIVMLESLNLAMTQATQRFMNYAEGKGNKEHLLSIFNNTVLLHIGLGMVILLLMIVFYAPLFNSIFNIPLERIDAAKYIYLFLAISAFFTVITVPYDAMINAHEDFLYYSIVGVITALLKLGAAFVVVYYMKDRLILYGLLMAGITVLNMIMMRIYCRLKYEECVFKPRKYGNVLIAKEIGVFAGWNFVGAFANMAGNHGSTILMNHFFGPVLIAAKNIADQICTQVAVLTSNMTKALNPVIVKSESSGNRQTMINLSYNSCRFSFLLYLVLAIPFILNTEPLLTIWLKEVPEWAILFCQLQVIRTLFEQLFTPLRMSLMAQGSVKQVNLVDLFLGIITFLILWLMYGLGFTAQCHYYISIIILVFVSGTVKVHLCSIICNMQVKDYIRIVIVPCCIVTLISCVVTYFIQQTITSVHTLMLVTIQVIVVFGIELIVGLTPQERRFILSKVFASI